MIKTQKTFAKIANTKYKVLSLQSIKHIYIYIMETTFDRFYPTHPGEVLKDELEERGISQRKFAESIGMGYSVLNEILNGKRPITTTSALMFEAALDIPADSLLKLQIKYNMHTARKDNALVEKLKQIRKVAAIL